MDERIAVRATARAAKDFATSDGVRRELAAAGIMLMDAPSGTTWRPGLPDVADGPVGADAATLPAAAAAAAPAAPAVP